MRLLPDYTPLSRPMNILYAPDRGTVTSLGCDSLRPTYCLLFPLAAQAQLPKIPPLSYRVTESTPPLGPYANTVPSQSSM
jgi:hypothetical protein